jgi:hypothetical protein
LGAWIDGKGRRVYLRHTHIKRIHNRQACLLIEVCRVTHESTAAQVLDGPRDTDDFCSAEINASEAVQVASSCLDSFLEFVGGYHHGNGFIDVERFIGVLFGSEFTEGVLGVFNAAPADEPPSKNVRGAM